MKSLSLPRRLPFSLWFWNKSHFSWVAVELCCPSGYKVVGCRLATAQLWKAASPEQTPLTAAWHLAPAKAHAYTHLLWPFQWPQGQRHPAITALQTELGSELSQEGGL